MKLLEVFVFIHIFIDFSLTMDIQVNMVDTDMTKDQGKVSGKQNQLYSNSGKMHSSFIERLPGNESLHLNKVGTPHENKTRSYQSSDYNISVQNGVQPKEDPNKSLIGPKEDPNKSLIGPKEYQIIVLFLSCFSTLATLGHPHVFAAANCFGLGTHITAYIIELMRASSSQN